MALWNWIMNGAKKPPREMAWMTRIRDDLKRRMKQRVPHPSMQKLSIKEQQLIEQIQRITLEKNRNNVTRTMAYLHVYLNHPELHWSFIAHMVSRNAGWNMTDLKGELLSRILPDKDRTEIFMFLERANWLIFQDAYPQLLLYLESKVRGVNLFYLLPYFEVSIFMESIWNDFWHERNVSVLTAGLIINEQNYIEQRVIQNPFFQQSVIHSLEFHLQDLLELNQILFPSATARLNSPQLYGLTVEHFASLTKRIEIGKKLYRLLFNPVYHAKFTEWATQHTHTGSRRDFWPQVFSVVQESRPGHPYQMRLAHCQLIQGAKRLYSPVLTQAWKETQHLPPEKGEWFSDWNILKLLKLEEANMDGHILKEYCHTLEKLELAVIAKEKILLG